MSRYLETASRYSDIPGKILDLVPEKHKQIVAELLPRLVNAGIVSVPRACQSTVRINIVKEVCKHIPVEMTLIPVEGKRDDGSTYSYKALVTEYIEPSEGTSSDQRWMSSGGRF